MEFRHGIVKSFIIKRRKLEGRSDPTKNDDSLTSKYMPSYRYWLQIEFEGGQVTTRTRPTKQECVEYVERCKRLAGSIM